MSVTRCRGSASLGALVHVPHPAHTCALPPLNPRLSAGSYAVYAVLNAGAALFLSRRMVETKLAPVERIRALLMGEGA